MRAPKKEKDLAATSRVPDSSSPSPLLAALHRLLRAHRAAFRQERTFRRMQALLFGHLFSFARRTVMQALVSLGLVDHDWSAFYRLFNEPRIDYEELTGCASSGRRCRTCWKRCRAFWIVSAVRKGGEWRLPYPVVELLEWAWQRWEVEVCHREMKTGFGLGEIQCWSKGAAILAVQWQAGAFGVLVLASHRAWGMSGGSIRPPGRWRGGVKRWSLSSLWRGYRAELWGSDEFRPTFAATGEGWPEKEGLLAGRGNAVNGSLRG